MNVIGIDPGASGGIVCLSDGGVARILSVHKMPETERDIVELLETWKRPRFAFIELVNAMPKQGVSSVFKFGRSYGFLRGALTALQIPFEDVTPQKWQTAMRCMSKGDKNVTKAAAQRLWPDVKWTHATADAALIAEYGRRRLQETGRL